jgi:hypothetical protein
VDDSLTAQKYLKNRDNTKQKEIEKQNALHTIASQICQAVDTNIFIVKQRLSTCKLFLFCSVFATAKVFVSV